MTSEKKKEKNRIYLFIYSISFNVIQPMWLYRQIPKHKITDMSKQRNQANKHPILDTPPEFIRNLLFPIFLTCLTYGAHSRCPVRICATVLASLFEARSKKDFFGAGGVMDSFPLSISESFAIVKCFEIRSLSHAIDVRPFRFSEAASPAS
jgi:hypothetical protein